MIMVTIEIITETENGDTVKIAKVEEYPLEQFTYDAEMSDEEIRADVILKLQRKGYEVG
jgi:hypothetical protein